MKAAKRFLLALGLLLVLLAAVLIVNTLRFTSKQIDVAPVRLVDVAEDSAATRLAQSIRYQTVSHQDPTQVKGDEFLAFHQFLKGAFPRIHATLSTEVIGDYIRTTTAATMFSGGIKENILPTQARAIVNFRILPGDSIKDVVHHVKTVVEDPRVRVEKIDASSGEPSPSANVDAAGFRTIQRTLRQVFPEVVVAPALVVGGTDSEHYTGLSNAVYRFAPLRLRLEDMSRLHGVNERTSVKDHARSVRFYYHLIGNSAR